MSYVVENLTTKSEFSANKRYRLRCNKQTLRCATLKNYTLIFNRLRTGHMNRKDMSQVRVNIMNRTDIHQPY